MTIRLSFRICIVGIVAGICGCSVPQTVSRLLPTRSHKIDDPLEKKSLLPSASYLVAKKELDHADQTTIEFARWKESIGDYKSARESYGNVVADDPTNVGARIGYARVEYQIGQKLEAEKILKATIAKFPKQAESYLELGRIYGDQKRWEEAVATLNQAVQLDPSDRTTNYELGLALAQADQTDKALKPLTVAVGSSAALYNIGYLLQKQGRMAEARDWMNRTLSSNPDENTRKNALKLMASLSTNGAFPNRSTLKTSTVNLAKTSYQSFTEDPSKAIQRTSAQSPSIGPAVTPVITAGPPGAARNGIIRNAAATRTLPPQSQFSVANPPAFSHAVSGGAFGSEPASATRHVSAQGFGDSAANAAPSTGQWQPASAAANAYPAASHSADPPRWRAASR